MKRRDRPGFRRVGAFVASLGGWLFIMVAAFLVVTFVVAMVSGELGDDSVLGFLVTVVIFSLFIAVPGLVGVWLIRVGRRLRRGGTVEGSLDGDKLAVMEGTSETTAGTRARRRRVRVAGAALVGALILGGITLLIAGAASFAGSQDTSWLENTPSGVLSIGLLLVVLLLVGFPFLLVSALFPSSSEKILRSGQHGPFLRRFHSTAVWLSKRNGLVWTLYVGYAVVLYQLAGIFITRAASGS